MSINAQEARLIAESYKKDYLSNQIRDASLAGKRELKVSFLLPTSEISRLQENGFLVLTIDDHRGFYHLINW